MLILTFRNVSDLAPISDYEWTVLANHTVLSHGRLCGHERAKGWEALVRQFVSELPWKKKDILELLKRGSV